MKCFWSISFLLLGSLLYSCVKTDVATGETISFTPNTVTPVYIAADITVKAVVTSVNDSRCPIGGVCIWAGELRATVQMDSQYSISLLQDQQKDTTYLGHKISFTLIDRTPFPNTSPVNPEPETKVKIKIVRQ